MRKLTANEINEVVDIFKATLEACSSKTAEVKTAESGVLVEGSEVDLASLPVGTTLFNDYGTAFKTSQGWCGSLPFGGGYVYDEEASSILAEEDSLKFMYGPSSSPVDSITFEDEDEWFEAVTEDELINFRNYPLYLDPATMDPCSVIRVNGSTIYFVAMADAFYNENGKELWDVDSFANDVARAGFPLRLEIYPRYR